MIFFNKRNEKYSGPVMSVQEIRTLILKKLSVALKPYGFRRDGSTFTRRVGVLTHIINLQSGKWNQENDGSYYINLAIYYGKVAEIESGNPSTETPKEYDGQLRSSLRGKGIPSSWDFSPEVDSVGRSDELVDAVIKYGVAYFDGIDTPLQLADCIMDKKKAGSGTIEGHISKAIIYMLEGDATHAQSEFDMYFRETKHIKDTDPISKKIKRRYLCIAQRAGLKLSFPEIDGEVCVGFYISMKGNQLVNDERRTRNKLETFLYNLEKKDLGYIHDYGELRRQGALRVGFCTKDPSFVTRYISDRKDKFACPLQEIVINDEF